MAADPGAPSAGLAADLVIVGAGAAGLWAAAVAARRGWSVLVLEKTPRTGTKILASGGTRCNLTTTLGPQDAARLFRGPGERFLRRAFRALPPAAVREHFHDLGVATSEAPLEKIFPTSGRARDVRDALERDAREAGARIQLDAPVVGLESTTVEGAPAWSVRVEGGASHAGRRVFLCAGGRSFPRTGCTGDGYAWLEALGLPLVETRPALVPLASPATWVHELTGLAWQGAEVRLVRESGKLAARRRRPVLFTHRGLSGPGAMDVSVHVAREGAGEFRLALDLFPDLEREELRDLLIEAARRKGAPRLSRVLPESSEGERVPRRLLQALCREAGLQEGDPSVAGIGKSARHGLIETVKGLVVPVDGVLGYDQAEVTTGGLALSAVNPATMEVRQCPGLHVFGELLDLDGPIGGLNFQAAWACAELAASSLPAL